MSQINLSKRKTLLNIIILAALLLTLSTSTNILAAPASPDNPLATSIADCYVDDDGSDTNGGTSWVDAKATIQACVNIVDSAGTVHVAEGTYDGDVWISKHVTITGAGAGDTIVDGGGTGRVFTITGVHIVNLNSMTIQNAYVEEPINGGGIYNNGGALTITDCTITGNRANDDNGGGVYNNGGTLTIDNSTFSGNYAGHRGGGIAHENGGTLTVTNTTFSGNQAEYGGGIVVPNISTTASITGCTFTGNIANYGGGINVFRGAVTVTKSTFSGNQASSHGGGINVSHADSDVSVTNSTFSGNTGPGASLASEDTLTITNSTIADNTSINGSLWNYGIGTLTLVNSIVSGTTGGGVNCFGLITDGGNNIDDANTCGFTGLNNTDPLLDPLADNGGPTETLALQDGSPAIDAGNDSLCPGTDQRGAVRPQGAHCDIGAYEADGTTPRFVYLPLIVHTFDAP